MGGSRRFLEVLAAFSGLSWCALSAAAEPQAVLTCLVASGPASTPSDRLVSGYSGRESRLRLSWLRHDEGLLPGVETSVALRLEAGLDALREGRAPELRDAGSWLGAGLGLGPGGSLRFQAFPFDTDEQRLGHLHALAWGGTDVERGESIFVDQEGGVPGVALGFASAAIDLEAGLRWATASAASQMLWGAQLRGSVRPVRALRVDWGLGYFQREAAPIAAERGFVEGASLRLTWLSGEVSEPELASEPFRAPTVHDAGALLVAPQPPGAALSLEGATLVTRLRRFEAPAQARLSLAPAAALAASFRGGRLAGHAAFSWRSLAFIERSSLGIMRGETVPAGAAEAPELALWAGASVDAGYGLTPSVQVGALLPAALMTASVLPGFAQTFVVREAGEVVALPIGSERLPVVAARAALRFDLSRALSLLGFVGYERDANRVRLENGALGGQRRFATPDRLAAGAAARASF